MKLIVGLGNPGREYSNNRHNAGFMCLAYLAKKHRIEFDRKKAAARIGCGRIEGIDVVLAKPQTFMNLSGESVSRLLHLFRLGPEDLIVIHDDMDLPLGKVRIRGGGSSGGHKGIDSVIRAIGTPDFVRIKIGIGRPPKDADSVDDERDIVDFVLSSFTPEEKKQLEPSIARAADAVPCLLTEGLKSAMNKYN